MSYDPRPPRAWWVPSVRGTALIATGTWCILLGLSFIGSPETPNSLLAYDGLIPLGVAAAVWLAAGAVCLVAVCLRRWRTAMTIAAAVHAAWAMSALVATFYGLAPRGWVTGAAYAHMAVLIVAVSLMTDPPRARHLRRPR